MILETTSEGSPLKMLEIPAGTLVGIASVGRALKMLDNAPLGKSDVGRPVKMLEIKLGRAVVKTGVGRIDED